MYRFLSLLFIISPTVFTCQPPMPVGFQANSLPAQVPAAPQYIPAIQQNQPQPPLVQDYEDSQQLEMINAPSSSYTGQQITPYPGYIPPPPAPSANRDSNYPTLIDNSEIPNVPLDHVHQQSSNTYQLERPVKIINTPQKNELSCPIELTSMTDFLTCVRRLSAVTVDESMLRCDFEKDSSCRFKSVTHSLSVGSFPTLDHYHTFSTLASRPEHVRPKGNFAFFVEHRGAEPDDEYTLSTSISCQRGNGILRFDYWIIGNHEDIVIKVCTQNTVVRSCTKPINYSRKSSTLSVEVVHPNSTYFDIEIVASNLIEPTIIVYDNIEYDTELCEDEAAIMSKDPNDMIDQFFDSNENPTSNQAADFDNLSVNGIEESDVISTQEPERTTTSDSLIDSTRPIRYSPIKPQKRKSVATRWFQPSMDDDQDLSDICKLLNCDFTNGMCSYKNYENETMVMGEWKVGNQNVGNPHTGIKDHNGGFLYVGTDSEGTAKIINYILESPVLTIVDDVELSLDVYRRSNDITLQICIDSPFYCPYSIAPFEKDIYWSENERFLIPKDTQKIFLRAIQWRKFKWLAVDNIRIVSDTC